MTVNLSVKNVPDDVARRLRDRAAANHRSLQGELMAILEEAALGSSVLSPEDVLREVRASGLRSPSESVDFIREDRDGGHGR
jgi:plasmid stability protein